MSLKAAWILLNETRVISYGKYMCGWLCKDSFSFVRPKQENHHPQTFEYQFISLWAPCSKIG